MPIGRPKSENPRSFYAQRVLPSTIAEIKRVARALDIPEAHVLDMWATGSRARENPAPQTRVVKTGFMQGHVEVVPNSGTLSRPRLPYFKPGGKL